ncbi:MAG TPA: DUF3788 family protein [Opitutaceae bacterium]|nr:DUF3788 family protein [Opitutaceae bacterium]
MKKPIAMHPDAAFPDEKRRPAESEIPGVLGRAFAPLNPLLAGLRAAHPDVVPEWQFSPRSGWHQIYSRKARRIFYLVPRRGGFVLNLLLGAKAIAALQAGPQAKAFASRLRAAKRYPEGTAFAFDAATLDAPLAGAMVEAKLAS